MATNAAWTVVLEDKIIINHSVKTDTDQPTAYIINDDSFWGQGKFSKIWAIQYGTAKPNTPLSLIHI